LLSVHDFSVAIFAITVIFITIAMQRTQVLRNPLEFAQDYFYRLSRR